MRWTCLCPPSSAFLSFVLMLYLFSSIYLHSLCVLYLKFVTCRHQMVGFCLLIHSGHCCLLIKILIRKHTQNQTDVTAVMVVVYGRNCHVSTETGEAGQVSHERGYWFHPWRASEKGCMFKMAVTSPIREMACAETEKPSSRKGIV